jgi:prolyl-tRNA editing enzyme YbaK/EbsC (Cys-tRNA(Pro) deacylase)
VITVSVERVQKYLQQFNPGLRVIEFEEDTSTSELAAQALGVEVGQIAKSMVYKSKTGYLMIVAAGDVRLDAKLIKQLAGSKVRMATPDETLEVTSHPVGGVCPFDLKTPIDIYLDESLKRFDVVYAAAGTARSALPIRYEELMEITGGKPCSVFMRQEQK